MSESEKAFYDELVRHRLILPSGVPGIFGRGPAFEDVLQRFNALVSRTAKADGAETLLFPPTMSRAIFEKSNYLESFPHLAGTVFSFMGKDADHHKLLDKVKGGQPWADTQSMTDVVLAPAGCYQVYPNFTGTLPQDGKLVTVEAWVFRHEPSLEPTRLQSFRMREFVRLATAEVCYEWRNNWLERGLELLTSLGLPAFSDTAADPFFGRGGRMLAANQREQKLKFEILCPVGNPDKPTAICSFNYHQDHFGELFDIKSADGKVAQTACLGFGLERVTMALFKTHGFVPSEWPKAVREKLWP